MKLLAVGVLVLSFTASAHAADHQWQRGIWRDVQTVTVNGGTISMPIGGTAPITVGGIVFPGQPPMYLTLPNDDATEYVTIDGPDGLRYVAGWGRHFRGIIMNDPIDFTAEGTHLFVRDAKPGHAFKLSIVKIIRLQQP